MAKLFLNIKNQTLTVHSDIGKIIENSVNYLDYEISTTDDWEDLTKKVIVTYNNGKNREEHTTGKIKNKVIQAPGFTISVVGYRLETVPATDTEPQKVITSLQITTNEVFVKIHSSGPIEGDNTSDEELIPTDKDRLNAVEQSIQGVNDTISTIENSLEEVNTELDTLSQKVDLMKIITEVKDNVLYFKYENLLE